ncbi:MAG TPA: tetratricopeptide repeat protein [Vicinamibacterales bacterium]|nr:tetratricopeptide repeat protein [Vicinamibacterales bacterium]
MKTKLLLLVAVVALVYQPVWHGGLLWDDDHHVTRAELQPVNGLWRIWTELGATQQYYPLAHSAFWLEHGVFGDEPSGYHVVNIGLHALSAYLLALVLRRAGVRGGVVAAFVFAVHPVNVESVAWISELKNTLSTALYLGAAIAYLRFDETRRRGPYVAALALFVLALATKTVTATLPASLLIVLWWRRGRIAWRRDVVPLLSFFAAGLAAGLLTAWVERTFVGAQGAEFHLTGPQRLVLAGRAVWFYLATLVWPSNLTFVYPRLSLDQPSRYLYPAAFATLVAVGWWLRTRTRAPLAVMLLFAVALSPALGFVDVFPFRYSFVADHFQYLATIPFAAVVGAATAGLPVPAAVAALVLCTPLAIVAHLHAREFESAETLYRATLARNPDAWMAHGNLATLLMARGETREAREHFLEALRVHPDAPETQMNAGRLLVGEGALDEGIEHLRAALRMNPGLPDARTNLGVALLRQNKPLAALAEFEAAVRIDPGHREAIANLVALDQRLGVEDAQAGRLPEAIAHFEAAVHYAPQDSGYRYDLGTAYLASGRPKDAVIQLQEAVRLDPRLAPARQNLVEAQRQAAKQ